MNLYLILFLDISICVQIMYFPDNDFYFKYHKKAHNKQIHVNEYQILFEAQDIYIYYNNNQISLNSSLLKCYFPGKQDILCFLENTYQRQIQSFLKSFLLTFEIKIHGIIYISMFIFHVK